ncbi:MAG: DUF1064 domain-containing protein, partial [Desulfurellales bacterium]
NKKSPSKYKNNRVKTPGQSFDSQLEAAIHQMLLLRERAGEIKNIRSQVTLRLTLAKIGYRVDFVATDCKTGLDFGIEAKGFPTEVWNIKKRLYRFYGPFRLEIWTGSHNNPKLTEIIVPEPLDPHRPGQDAPCPAE